MPSVDKHAVTVESTLIQAKSSTAIAILAVTASVVAVWPVLLVHIRSSTKSSDGLASRAGHEVGARSRCRVGGSSRSQSAKRRSLLQVQMQQSSIGLNARQSKDQGSVERRTFWLLNVAMVISAPSLSAKTISASTVG